MLSAIFPVSKVYIYLILRQLVTGGQDRPLLFAKPSAVSSLANRFSLRGFASVRVSCLREDNESCYQVITLTTDGDVQGCIFTKDVEDICILKEIIVPFCNTDFIGDIGDLREK